MYPRTANDIDQLKRACNVKFSDLLNLSLEFYNHDYSPVSGSLNPSSLPDCKMQMNLHLRNLSCFQKLKPLYQMGTRKNSKPFLNLNPYKMSNPLLNLNSKIHHNNIIIYFIAIIPLY